MTPIQRIEKALDWFLYSSPGGTIERRLKRMLLAVLVCSVPLAGLGLMHWAGWV